MRVGEDGYHKLVSLFQSISAVTTACREIRTSRKFAKLLEVRLISYSYFRIWNII